MNHLVRSLLDTMIAVNLVYSILSWFQWTPGYQWMELEIIPLVPLHLLAILKSSRGQDRSIDLYSGLLILWIVLNMCVSPGGNVASQAEWLQARFIACFFMFFFVLQRRLLRTAGYI